MRRKDREVKDEKEILNIMNKCKVCRIAMQDEAGLYIVPMNFGYEYDGQFTLYFHSSKEGRKMNVIKNEPDVAFEMDCEHQLVKGQQACRYSYLYQSIIGEGKIQCIYGDEKKKALNILMKHQTNKEFEFNDQMCESVFVFKIKVRKLSAKSHI